MCFAYPIFCIQHLDVWRFPSKVNVPADIQLSPLDYVDVTSALNDHGIETHDFIEDVQRLIEGQKRTENRSPPLSEFDYSKYHTLQEVCLE